VYFSVGTANREPTRADIKDAMKYGNNQTPKPERLIDYEAGYTYKSQSFALGVNLYYMDYQDQLVLTGKLSDVGYPLMTNVEKSYRMGTEIMAGFMPAKWVRWDANVALSENKIISFREYVDLYDSDYNFAGQRVTYLGNTDISFSPNVVASSHLRFTPIDRMGIALITKYVGRQYIDNTSNASRMLDAYSVSNLKLDYSFNVKGTKGLNVSFLLNNVFNNMYIANAWVYREAYTNSDYEYVEIGYYPQAEFNYMLRLSIDF
jgi:iron complex outermembrane recepter protein